MDFTFDFLKGLFSGLGYLSPVLVFLLLKIVLEGLWGGMKESWKPIDALYFAFITATTVGYGDMRPSKRGCKIVAISIALMGIVLTGIIVAVALHAIEDALLVQMDKQKGLPNEETFWKVI